MESSDVMRLGLILAVQAEIEGMKSENENRKQENYNIAYTDEDFQAKAEELRNVVYCPDIKL